MADVMVDADISTLEAILEGFDHILRGYFISFLFYYCCVFLFFFLLTHLCYFHSLSKYKNLKVGAEDIYKRGSSHYNSFALYFDASPLKEKVF